MKKMLFAAMVLIWSACIFAMPSLGEVKAQIAAKNYAQAEIMLQQVIAEKPSAPLPHYVLSQVMASEGNIDGAKDQLQSAKALGLTLKPSAVAHEQQFEAWLNGPHEKKTVTTVTSGSTKADSAPVKHSDAQSVPQSTSSMWPLLVTLLVSVLAIWFVIWMIARKNRQVVVVNTSDPFYSSGSMSRDNVVYRDNMGSVGSIQYTPRPATRTDIQSSREYQYAPPPPVYQSPSMQGHSTGSVIGAGVVGMAAGALLAHELDAHSTHGDSFNRTTETEVVESDTTACKGGVDYNSASDWDSDSIKSSSQVGSSSGTDWDSGSSSSSSYDSSSSDSGWDAGSSDSSSSDTSSSSSDW